MVGSRFLFVSFFFFPLFSWLGLQTLPMEEQQKIGEDEGDVRRNGAEREGKPRLYHHIPMMTTTKEGWTGLDHRFMAAARNMMDHGNTTQPRSNRSYSSFLGMREAKTRFFLQGTTQAPLDTHHSTPPPGGGIFCKWAGI